MVGSGIIQGFKSWQAPKKHHTLPADYNTVPALVVGVVKGFFVEGAVLVLVEYVVLNDMEFPRILGSRVGRLHSLTSRVSSLGFLSFFG